MSVLVNPAFLRLAATLLVHCGEHAVIEGNEPLGSKCEVMSETLEKLARGESLDNQSLSSLEVMLSCPIPT